MKLTRSTALAFLSIVLAAPMPRASAQCSRGDDHRLLSSTAKANGFFGWDVAVSGDVLIAGARNEASAAGSGSPGKAHVYRRSGAAWVEEQVLENPFASGSGFGRVVALDGDVAAIADGELGTRVHVFRFDGADWVLEQSLTGPGGAPGAGWGRNVAIGGSTLLVGAQNANPFTLGPTGAVYVYVETGGVWTQQQILVPPGSTATEDFGWAVALDGDVALVGAPARNGNRGAAYVFRRNGVTWTMEEVFPSPSTSSEYFGTSVALSGDVAVVGAYSDNGGGAGIARVYRRSAAVWALEKELRPYGVPAGSRFGAGVAIDGDRIAVCSQLDDSVHLFERRSGVWSLLTRLEASSQTGYWEVNYRGEVALSGAWLAHGAPGDDVAFAGSGSVFAYDLAGVSPICTYCTARTDDNGCAPAISFSGVPSESAGSGFSVSASGVSNQRLGMLYFSVTGPASTAFAGGINCLAAPQRVTSQQLSGGSPVPASDCSGALALDFNAWMSAGTHPQLFAGRQVFAQFRYRDGALLGLTDALQFVIEP